MTQPNNRVTLAELARELRLNRSGVTKRAERLNICIKPVRFMSRSQASVTQRDAEALRASFAADTIRPDEGWLPAEIVVRRLRCPSVDSLQERRARGALQIEVRRVVGHGNQGGGYWLYNPADVAREEALLPVRPTFIPRGTLISADLRRVMGVSRASLEDWVAQGCPYHLTSTRRRYYKPPEVLAWLARTPINPRSTHAHKALRAEQVARLTAWIAEPKDTP